MFVDSVKLFENSKSDFGIERVVGNGYCLPNSLEHLVSTETGVLMRGAPFPVCSFVGVEPSIL